MFGAAVVLLTVHAAVCALALVFLPHGFPLDSLRAWTDLILPSVALTLLSAALVRFVFMKSSGMPVALALAAAAGGWLGAIGCGLVLFPTSFHLERAIGPLAIALAISALALMIRLETISSSAAAVLGIGFGVTEILGQRGPPPSTRPIGGELAEVHGEPSTDDAATGQVSFPCGKEHVRIRPLLTFESRSPDATWTVLAPPSAFGPHRKLTAFSKDASGFRAHYTDDGESTLIATKDAKGLDIEATSKLPHPVWSHLNSFALIHIPFDATISFSAIGPERFPVEPFDYPSGRPAKLAYLGADSTLHVVIAQDAEKGPYRELAKGHLGRDEPLTITIRHQSGDKDGECRLTFKDWAAEVSTELSPTAGWRVPQNSIQFFAHQHEAAVFLTLAETGPGRGWHSVAHQAGTYKNRVRVDTTMSNPK